MIFSPRGTEIINPSQTRIQNFKLGKLGHNAQNLGGSSLYFTPHSFIFLLCTVNQPKFKKKKKNINKSQLEEEHGTFCSPTVIGKPMGTIRELTPQLDISNTSDNIFQ